MPSLQIQLFDILFVLVINEKKNIFFEKRMGVSEFIDVFPQVSLN